MTRLLLDNVRPFDSRRGKLGPPSRIVVEGARIAEVTSEPRTVDGARRIDGGGRVALPGLIDAHVHVTAYMHDLMGQALKPPSLIVAESSRILRAMLLRGFTTVRDAAGADFGLQEAVAKGLFAGPRLFIAGFPISQTGGHADMRPKGVRQREMFCTCAGLGLIGAIADGVGEVRRAVREQVRNGANQIKIMAGGGISSPSDPLEGTQFSIDELRAACEEAEAANLYAMAHAYSPRAVTRAVQAGVRSIEHGNLIREAAAKAIKDAGAFLVPTMITYEMIYREGKRYGIGDHQIQKINLAREQSVQGLTYAYRAGCQIGSGSDLLGDMMVQRAVEFELKAQVMKPMEVLLSATKVNAALFRLSDRIGTVEPGKYADLIVVAGDPLRNLRVFQIQDNLKVIMKGGHAYKQTL